MDAEKDYLEIVTSGHYFSIGQNELNSGWLLFGWPGSSHWMYELDGITHDDLTEYIYDSETGKYIGVTTVDDISIVTELYVTKSTSTGLRDVAAIVLKATNIT
jgi:hypothetical protein